MLFCIAFGLMLFFSLIMGLQSKHFYTMDVVKKKFSIMDLELPATATELVNLIKGLFDTAVAPKSARAVKGQLWIDFLFMPCAYGSIFIICMLISNKMDSFGINVFKILAWAQAVPWLLDIIENIYLLSKIKKIETMCSNNNFDRRRATSKPGIHKAYLIMEGFKWGIALLAVNCAVAAIFYFFLSGHYGLHLLNYLLIVIAEIAGFFILSKLFGGKKATA